MSDTPTPFILRPQAYRSYPLRHDHLLQQGSLLWQRASASLTALLEQAPHALEAMPATATETTLEQPLKQRWLDYWNSRAPGTGVSRRAAAEQAFLEHMQAAARLAYYHGQLSHTQLRPLLTLLEGRSTTEPPTIYVETLALHTNEGTKLKAAGALVLTPDSDAPVAQLLYLPTHNPALLAFADRQSLQTYLLQNTSEVWPASKLQADAAVHLGYQPAQLASACKQWLSHCRSLYLQAANSRQLAANDEDVATPAPANRAPFAELPAFAAPDPEELGDPSATFGSLSPDIPQSHRWAALKRQHQAMLDMLGDNLQAGNDSPAWTRLKALRAALSQAQERASQAAAGLLGAEKLEDLYRLRYLPNTHYSALYQARLDGLRAEVALQHALGLLTTAQAHQVNAVLSHPQARQRSVDDGVACAVSLTISSVTGTSTLTHVQELPGVVAFTPRSPHRAMASSCSTGRGWAAVWKYSNPARSSNARCFASPPTTLSP